MKSQGRGAKSLHHKNTDLNPSTAISEERANAESYYQENQHVNTDQKIR
jgi:hypothetical protein